VTDPTTTAGPQARHVSSYHLELRRLGEMPGDDQVWMDQHLRACAACADLALAHVDRRRQFEGPVQARSLAALAVRFQSRRRRWSWRHALGIGLLVPVAAGFLLLVSMGRHRPWRSVDDGVASHPAAEPELTAKGGPGFLLVARRGDRVFRVTSREALRPHDQVRFVLEHVQYPYVLIASVDGRGHANVYVPYEGSQSAAVGGVAGGDRVEIPGSIVIDDSPGPERMFALLSRKPLSASMVRAALKALGSRGAQAIRAASSLEVDADEQLSLAVEKIVGN
jgi:hypothetical protein